MPRLGDFSISRGVLRTGGCLCVLLSLFHTWSVCEQSELQSSREEDQVMSQCTEQACETPALGYVAHPDRHGSYISQQLGGYFKFDVCGFISGYLNAAKKTDNDQRHMGNISG